MKISRVYSLCRHLSEDREMNEHTILDRIPYMVWTYDASGTINFVNAAWIKYTGLDQ